MYVWTSHADIRGFIATAMNGSQVGINSAVCFLAK